MINKAYHSRAESHSRGKVEELKFRGISRAEIVNERYQLSNGKINVRFRAT